MASSMAAPVSAAGRILWSDIDSDVEAEIIAEEAAAHTGADTPTIGTIAARTFRTTPVSVRELANMGHKTFMFHSDDTMVRMRALIFVKFGIPSAHQRLFFRGTVLGGEDNTLFSPALLGERLVHVADLRVVEVRVKLPGGFADLQLKIPPTL